MPNQFKLPNHLGWQINLSVLCRRLLCHTKLWRAWWLLLLPRWKRLPSHGTWCCTDCRFCSKSINNIIYFVGINTDWWERGNVWGLHQSYSCYRVIQCISCFGFPCNHYIINYSKCITSTGQTSWGHQQNVPWHCWSYPPQTCLTFHQPAGHSLLQ